MTLESGLFPAFPPLRGGGGGGGGGGGRSRSTSPLSAADAISAVAACQNMSSHSAGAGSAVDGAVLAGPDAGVSLLACESPSAGLNSLRQPPEANPLWTPPEWKSSYSLPELGVNVSLAAVLSRPATVAVPVAATTRSMPRMQSGAAVPSLSWAEMDQFIAADNFWDPRTLDPFGTLAHVTSMSPTRRATPLTCSSSPTKRTMATMMGMSVVSPYDAPQPPPLHQYVPHRYSGILDPTQQSTMTTTTIMASAPASEPLKVHPRTLTPSAKKWSPAGTPHASTTAGIAQGGGAVAPLKGTATFDATHPAALSGAGNGNNPHSDNAHTFAKQKSGVAEVHLSESEWIKVGWANRAAAKKRHMERVTENAIPDQSLLL